MKVATKATKFSQIQDAVAFNNPIDNTHEFYTDFSGLRKDFSEKKLYKLLNIIDGDCNPLESSKKLFLRGHRGTGKTSELLTLKNKIKETKCYFVVFADLSSGELDVNNIDIVDILILLLEKLISELEEDGAEVPSDILEPFYKWYEERIVEINDKVDISAKIEIETEAGITIPFFSKLLAKTTGKLGSSNETKESIRRVFTNNISDFSLKFNEFILSLKETLKEKNKYEDLLFVVDGFEKIGSLENRKKVIIDDSVQFNNIRTNMLITLPIELFEHSSVLESFSKIISFPLIVLTDKSKEKFREFILKRVDEALFKDTDTIDKIIEFGAGSPRETLRIILEAFTESEDEIIDLASVSSAIEVMGKQQTAYLEAEEIAVLKKIHDKEDIPFDSVHAGLLVKKIILEYGDENPIINPVVLENQKFKRLIEY